QKASDINFCQLLSEELIYGLKIDRKRVELALRPSLLPMGIGANRHERFNEFPDPLVVGMKARAARSYVSKFR
ncbi:MAG: hypothetical protein WCB75_09185, partial [Pseudolabrys sp.]